MPGDDDLSELLDLIRREADLDQPVLDRIGRAIQARFAGDRVYVSRAPSRADRMSRLQQLPADAGTALIAEALGVSRVTAWRYKNRR